MALGSTQPLAEMSTRNLPGGKGLTALPPFVSRLSRENVGASTSHSHMGPHGLLQGWLFLLPTRNSWQKRCRGEACCTYLYTECTSSALRIRSRWARNDHSRATLTPTCCFITTISYFTIAWKRPNYYISQPWKRPIAIGKYRPYRLLQTFCKLLEWPIIYILQLHHESLQFFKSQQLGLRQRHCTAYQFMTRDICDAFNLNK
jgi:hypothetical protein